MNVTYITEVKLSLNLVLYGLSENPSKQEVINKITERLTSDDLHDQILNSLSCLTGESILDIDTWVIRSTQGPE